MHRNRPFFSRRRRLHLGGGAGGGLNMDYVVAGGLALLIVLALGFAVYGAFFRTPGTDFGGDGKNHFICDECQHEVVLTQEQTAQRRRESRSEEEVLLLDCPNCQAKKSCYPAVHCPECGTYYVLNDTKVRARMQAEEQRLGRPLTEREYERFESESKKTNCPKCGTNRADYYREHAND